MNFRILSAKVQKYTQILKAIVQPRSYDIYPRKKYAHHRVSFSQEGEDLVLMRIFEGQENGFYVDIGAHHPQRFSNTYLFYLKGWHGINIDAMPGSMDIFNRLRSRDINLEVAISDSEKDLKYYMFNEPALNGFSEHISTSRNQSESYKIIGEKNIRTQKLSSVLEEYLPSNQAIDFLSIDVEGFDCQVLLSNDWSKYRPKIILIEELSISSIDDFSEVRKFLKSKNYKLFSKTFSTSFYCLESA